MREEKALSLEQAVKRITSEPADFFGFKNRGRLQAGAAADIVIFDENKIGSPLRSTPVNDLPAGGTRLYSKAEGISQVVVNGRILYQDGKHTGAIYGEILRSRCTPGASPRHQPPLIPRCQVDDLMPSLLFARFSSQYA